MRWYGSEVVDFDLVVSVAFQVDPSPKQKHEFGQTNIFSLFPIDEATILQQLSVGFRIHVKKTQKELIRMLQHSHPERILRELLSGRFPLLMMLGVPWV